MRSRTVRQLAGSPTAAARTPVLPSVAASIVSASASGQGRKTRHRLEIVEFLVIANVQATRVP